VNSGLEQLLHSDVRHLSPVVRAFILNVVYAARVGWI